MFYNLILPSSVFSLSHTNSDLNPVSGKVGVWAGRFVGMVVWLIGCVLRPTVSEVIQKRIPHFLSLLKLGFYTVPTMNRTPGRHVAVHYTTAAPHQLPSMVVRYNTGQW